MRPAWLEIDLGAIRANVLAVRSWIGPAEPIVIVKANAYGHGLVPVATAAMEAGARWLGVAILDEAVALREAGVAGPILVLGACDDQAASELVRFGIDSAVSTPESVLALSREACAQGRTARFHLKIDTGMGRVGVFPHEAAPLFQAASAPGIEWAGLMTHFATSDADDLAFARAQWAAFSALFTDALRARHSPGPLFTHAANSAAVCRMPETYAARPGLAPLVRPGLLTYGVPPAPGPCPPIRQAMALKARITQARTVPAGTTVSYGATFTARRPTRLALIPLGYADGYPRACSNRASVLLRGRRVPIAGRVCMDQFVVDATETGAEVGDEAVLLGTQGSERITVDECAAWGDTIHHELLARMSARLPRVYTGGDG